MMKPLSGAVIPAKAEALFNSECWSIHLPFCIRATWIPAFAHYCPARFLRESINRLMAVIPANAGIHGVLMQKAKWIPAFAGMTALRFMALFESPHRLMTSIAGSTAFLLSPAKRVPDSSVLSRE